MNKKFFAALASATMAFTASGSIAVFADDFVEEKTPVVDGELKPIPATVVWNEENFGDLVNGEVTFDGGFTAPKKDEEIKTSELDVVKTITLGAKFEGEIKGLEYFTELTQFNDSTPGVKVTNKKLDFSANTKMQTLYVTNAVDVAEVAFPKPVVNDKKEEKYSLQVLLVKNTKLTSLDLSAQEELVHLVATNNANLKEVTLHPVTKDDNKSFSKLDLSHNALETINLDNYTVANLDLSYNHIGALDLRDANVTSVASNGLENQTFYVSELLASVNLKETFPALNVNKVTATSAHETKFDSKTGVLTLAKEGDTTYTYNVDGTNELEVTLKVANPMNRLYNPNSGEHFYTADITEKEALVALGWQDEGFGWVAPSKAEGQAAVYRLYNPNAGDHHYTMDDKEVKTLVAYGWKAEGTGWYSAGTKTEQPSTGKVAVYRQYNPYANGAGSHNYTTDKAENDYLVSLGWTPEGTAWLALQ